MEFFECLPQFSSAISVILGSRKAFSYFYLYLCKVCKGCWHYTCNALFDTFRKKVNHKHSTFSTTATAAAERAKTRACIEGTAPVATSFFVYRRKHIALYEYRYNPIAERQHHPWYDGFRNRWRRRRIRKEMIYSHCKQQIGTAKRLETVADGLRMLRAHPIGGSYMAQRHKERCTQRIILS